MENVKRNIIYYTVYYSTESNEAKIGRKVSTTEESFQSYDASLPSNTRILDESHSMIERSGQGSSSKDTNGT